MAPDSKSTQQFVDIETIKNGTIVLKSGGLRRVLLVSGINFELKSQDEQNITLGAYQNFLNSLDFSLQIVIHSRKLDIKNYIKNLEELQDVEKNDLLKDQINEYLSFIKSFVESNEIMAKNFFVIVPYEPEVVSEGANKIFSGLFGNKKSKKDQENQTLEERMSQITQRVDQVISGLVSIGLRAVELNDEELIELFYNLYNPQVSGTKEIKFASK